jgi:hypothetical protein
MPFSTFTTSTGRPLHSLRTRILIAGQAFYFLRSTQRPPSSRQSRDIYCKSVFIQKHRQQPHPATNATVTDHWITLLLTYARHRKLFVLRVEDTETAESEWHEILRNERINRALLLNLCVPSNNGFAGKMLPSYLSTIIATMVSKNLATYDPPGQTRSALLYWRLPEEWAEVLHGWVRCSSTFIRMLSKILPGDIDGSIEHNTNILRDCGSAHTVSSVQHSYESVAQGHRSLGQDGPLPVNRHRRRRGG